MDLDSPGTGERERERTYCFNTNHDECDNNLPFFTFWDVAEIPRYQINSNHICLIRNGHESCNPYNWAHHFHVPIVLGPSPEDGSGCQDEGQSQGPRPVLLLVDLPLGGRLSIEHRYGSFQTCRYPKLTDYKGKIPQ